MFPCQELQIAKVNSSLIVGLLNAIEINKKKDRKKERN